jgi:shikimate dehydrogenase
MIRQYGLIGKNLSHSFSKAFFDHKFEQEGILDARYALFPLDEISKIEALIHHTPGLRGLNVTIPYKITVIPFLDALDDTSERTGAVNTIKMTQDGRRLGFNTDLYGFIESLLRWMPYRHVKHGSALILGNGGASKAVQAGLDQIGVPWNVVSRNPGEAGISYHELEYWLRNHPPALIINTTPLGMYPDLHSCPDLPWHCIGAGYFVYDLVYNPTKTLLLQRASENGASIKNGLEMLHLQAESAWQLWQQSDTPTQPS